MRAAVRKADKTDGLKSGHGMGFCRCDLENGSRRSSIALLLAFSRFLEASLHRLT